MLKTIVTLARGAAFRAEEELTDRSALLILDQQIRDSAVGIERAKRALAVAIAQDEAEGKRLETTLARIADLEERAVAALDGEREELANEAAEAIAVMEADRDSIREARATFAREIAGLKTTVRKSGQRLAELERGRRIAQAAESVRRLKAGSGLATPGGGTALADAEATLRRLREKQAEDAAASNAYEVLDSEPNPVAIADRLEAAGFGKRTRPTAASVLERLKEKASARTPAA
ncbi:MAG TPA: PspA/IM30 family protein [Xanthobacteraceae bacterium]|jgi:phage shock protein A|nr:PspA/IM30 family protein [Xanthobacteraceae bacterium]